MKHIKSLGVLVKDLQDQLIPQVTAVILTDFLSMALRPRTNIIDPFLPEAGLGMIYAERGIGKTFFALELAMAVANGGEFLKFKAPKPARVLYIDGEMPANTMQSRLIDIKNRMIINPGFIDPMLITPDLQSEFMPNLSTSEGAEAVRKYTDQADLIIVDNISTLCSSGKENDAESWIPIQRWALNLRRQGKSVLFIHHAGKNGSQRGTSKREDILDTVILLKRPKEYEPQMGASFEIHFEKSRGVIGEGVEPIACYKTENGWAYSTLEETNYQRVVSLASDGLKQKDIAEELNLSKGQVSKLYNKAIKDGLVKK